MTMSANKNSAQSQPLSAAQPLARAVLFAGAMVAGGCIVPEPLTTDTPPQSVTPVILDDPGHPFGLFALANNAMEPITVIAESSNQDDMLRARLFKQVPGSSTFALVIDTAFLSTDPSDP